MRRSEIFTSRASPEHDVSTGWPIRIGIAIERTAGSLDGFVGIKFDNSVVYEFGLQVGIKVSVHYFFVYQRCSNQRNLSDEGRFHDGSSPA